MKSAALILLFSALTLPLFADGLVLPRKDYAGSLAERAQEAIIIFTSGSEEKSAEQDLILKISVEGKAEEFAWIVPLPSVPEVGEEDPALFGELFDYVEARKRMLRGSKGSKDAVGSLSMPTPAAEANAVEVIKRETVGSFDVTTVKENAEGGLLPWLEANGYRAPEGAESTLNFYRELGFVFACIKVSGATLAAAGPVELHPLRFSFETGGRDGIYFPMKLTGLQEGSFDVNLYVFRSSWINDHLNAHGFEHRGFQLVLRDWDSDRCKANAGKSWSLPSRDPYLAATSERVPAVTRLFQKRHPGGLFYLTNIRARNLEASDVRGWKQDLWLYPYYTDPDFAPYDTRDGGVASR